MHGPTIRPSPMTLFCEALNLDSPADRAAYLDGACAGDPALRARVEALLAAHGRADGFLEAPAAGPTLPMAPPGFAEASGASIGPYRLLERIGEGGMGTVYMAEQVEPVRRKVALKVIKQGMDSREVVARFEAERQALALMDHPNIARVHDGGTTASGRPYFVMELVKGVPITEYCDRERLTVPERLELFVLVCRAVQHAHQKGVIHRDLKPSNVLVTVVDGAALPKVIDFGVAKATGGSLTERTLFTGFTQLVGTPLYMSPEQAELSGVDVDTRSDVYSLGVLLYELLTGTTPFDPGTLRRAALDELRRILREEEPPRPSTRLSALGEMRSAVSASRGADARHLDRAVRGELDWVVMKALEKDRRRRYEAANDLAADVMRHLTDRPVEACPPSAWYRLAKSARRNRAALTTAALVGLALVGGTAASLWQAGQARRAEREARARVDETRQVLDYLVQEVFGAAEPGRWRGDGPMTVGHLLDRADATLAERFRGQPLVEARCRAELAAVYLNLDGGRAEANAARAVELFSRALGPDHPETLRARGVQIHVLGTHWGDPVREGIRIPLMRGLLADRLRVLGPAHPETIAIMSSLADALVGLRQFDEAEALGEQALADAGRFLGPEHPVTLDAGRNLAIVAIHHGDDARAEGLLRSVVEARLRSPDPLHVELVRTLRELADVLKRRGRLAEGTRVMERAFEASRQLHAGSTLGGAHWVQWTFGALVEFYRAGGDPLAIRDLSQRWIAEILATPRPPVRDRYDPRSVRLAVAARTLLTLPAAVPIDAALAVRAAEEAVALSDGEHGRVTLALAYDRAGRLDEAMRALERARARPDWDDGDRYACLVSALVHAHRGEAERAREWYARARVLGPADDPGRDGLRPLREEVEATTGVAAPNAQGGPKTARGRKGPPK